MLAALGKPLPNTITFKQYVDIYMSDYTGKDPSTVGRLNWWCEQFGQSPMLKITDDDVDTALIKLSKRVTGSTTNRYKSTLEGRSSDTAKGTKNGKSRMLPLTPR